MKMRKFKLIPLVAICLFSVGCSNNNTSSTTESACKINYFNVKAISEQIEIGQEVRVAISISADNGVSEGFTFSISDTSIAEGRIEGKSIYIKGLKAGDFTLTVTCDGDTTMSKSVKLTVIATRPSLQQVFANMQELDSYTLTIGEASDGEITKTVAYEYVTPETVLYVTEYGNAVYTDSSSNNIYGESVASDGKVAYLKGKGANYVKKDAEIVQTNAGLLTKDNFRGLKDKTTQPFQVGEIYTFDAFNPSWFTDTKNEDNEYVIKGESTENGNATYIEGAYAECMLWKLADYKDFKSTYDALGDGYYFSLAQNVITTITVEAYNQIAVEIDYGSKTYRIEMSYIDDTDLSDSNFSMDNFTGLTVGNPVINSDITKAVTAIEGNNYVQVNSMFPDHSTELTYNTYYTDNYVFFDCNENFVNEYNTHLSSDNDTWTKIPYGYVKKADGIYSFTYDEDNNTVSVSETKEANTDASTQLCDFANYFSTIDSFNDNSDVLYSFSSESSSIWNNHNTKYFSTGSRKIFDDFINYYAPEDIEDVIENVKSGLGVEFNADGSVATVNCTLGYTPFVSNNNTITSHTYGVDYFSLTSFGSATDNKVNTLLASYINK